MGEIYFRVNIFVICTSYFSLSKASVFVSQQTESLYFVSCANIFLTLYVQFRLFRTAHLIGAQQQKTDVFVNEAART
jgi:hypothetical protein